MARALLTKVHLWRSNGVINTTTIRSLTYLLQSNNSTRLHNQVVSRESSSASDEFRFINRSYCTGAKPQVDESPSVESPLMKSMANKIKEHLNAESVIVKDAYGDGRHVSIYVISAAFEGQNTVTRQRTVYKAIWEELQDTVHAVHQMITLTPTEAKTKNQ